MKTPIDKQTAEVRVVRKASKLYVPLMDLVTALQNLEPGGTLVDDAIITRKEGGGVHIEYKARPLRLSIIDESRKFTSQIDELSKQ